MAALPPRRSASLSRSSKKDTSPLDVLIQLGFKRNRAEKALAATGDRGVQLASDWLLAHFNDPHLDDRQSRDFFLYACPGGALLDQIETFMRRSLEKCGRNGAHSLLPHVTLCSPFQVPNHSVPTVVDLLLKHLRVLSEQLSDCWPLERYASHNYIGLFVERQVAATLTSVVTQLSSEAAKLGVNIEPQTDSLRLSLAYQFGLEKFDELEAMSAALDLSAPSQWQLRLYSRDCRLASCQVHQVMFSHVPRQPDELELLVGDYVYVAAEALRTSPDDWVQACSWLTGQEGFAPANYLREVPESDAWTVHRVISLSEAESASVSPSPSLLLQDCQQQRLRRSLSSLESQPDLLLLTRPVSCHDTPRALPISGQDAPRALLVSSHDAPCASPVPCCDAPPAPPVSSHDAPRALPICHTLSLPSDQDFVASDDGSAARLQAACVPRGLPDEQRRAPACRQVWVVRHGERVDFTYGQWIPYCFDDAGCYDQKDLNMPFCLKDRSDGPRGFSKDSPITHVGRLQARLTGEAMRRKGVVLHHVYCSPSLRCLETAYSLLCGLGVEKSLRLCVEPGLFEWLHWYRDGLPSFLPVSELASWGFPVDLNYQPVLSLSDLSRVQESCEQYYRRSHRVTETVLRKTEGNVLLVAHAASVDTCTRQLVGSEPRSVSQLSQFLGKVPYCAAVCASKLAESDQWQLNETGFASLTHSHNQRFDLSMIR